LRDAVAVRVRKITETMVAFSENRMTLPPQILCALARELWGGNIVYDPVVDLLRSLAPPAQPMGITPPPIDPSKLPYVTGPWTKGSVHGLPPSPQATPLTRPGWAR